MSNFYLIEIFDDQFTFKSSTMVDIAQTIELDYLTFNPYKITTLPLAVEKGCFIHITQDGQLVADGIVADVQPEDELIEITIRPLQALFDIEVFYSAVSDCITWLATNIGEQLATNSDVLQNRPLELTYTTASEDLPLTGFNFNATINVLSVISSALKTYGVVVDAYLDIPRQRIVCNIEQQSASDVLEADLENVLDKAITLGDSYGSANKLVIQKIQSNDGEVTVLGQSTYYLHPNGTVTTSNTNRITPVFYALERLELEAEETTAEWNAKAKAKAVEVLSPQKYDNEIVLSYHRDDKIANPMDIAIGTATTIYVDGVAYSSLLTGRTIQGNVVTLIFGAVRTELTKKLILQKGNTGTVRQVMSQLSPQLNEIFSKLEDVPTGRILYTSPTQLGLSTGCTIDDILAAMPNGSMGAFSVNDLASDEVPAQYSTTFIAKNSNTRVSIVCTNRAGTYMFIRNDGSNSWTRIAPLAGGTNPPIQTINYNFAYSSLAANTMLSITGDDFGISTPSGYAPVGIAYFNSGNDRAMVRSVNGIGTGTTNVMVIRNTHTSAISGTASLRVIYAKNS